jgi:hypothetical protein
VSLLVAPIERHLEVAVAAVKSPLERGCERFAIHGCLTFTQAPARLKDRRFVSTPQLRKVLPT